MFEPLERVRMTESERRAAEVYLAQGEAVADFIISMGAGIRLLVHRVERGIRTRTRATSAHR
jgi:hypothetical protein